VNATRSHKEPRIPVVLSKDKVKQILILIDGSAGLIVRMLYAGGLHQGGQGVKSPLDDL
jgi:hypothetical protein